ncbi:helix-turn-helix transcriptional regulator [Thermosporothrix hazakensis]|uniref:helix-turn-helix transcriptional regulator n=1 Tax=Thermosporothrix hazakensis TaxID=644383 RepID=UPI0010F61FE5|nr:helix-turn-helix transcriptional regulator [Thermosporothrix hazakensis]
MLNARACLPRLNEALSHPITLIQAPAGFGQTTAVLQWMNRRHRTATIAWVSLDTQDNDLHRFWRSIIAAYQSLNESIGRAALAQLSAITRPPFEQISIEVILTHFINDLAQQKQDGLLVKDHVKHIRQKLGVNNRLQASEIARRLHLNTHQAVLQILSQSAFLRKNGAPLFYCKGWST